MGHHSDAVLAGRAIVAPEPATASPAGGGLLGLRGLQFLHLLLRQRFDIVLEIVRHAAGREKVMRRFMGGGSFQRPGTGEMVRLP